MHLTDPPKLRELDTRMMLETAPEPLDWLAEGVWARGKLTLFGGREKRGKSLVQLVLAVMMASGGGEIAGIKVKAGRVLIIDAENGEREVHRRLRAVGLASEDAENLTACEARGFDLREDLELAATLADRHQVDLVVFDSFRALWRGDERDEADVAAALYPVGDLAHDTGRACTMTHHAQKGGEEYRGSSAIGACVDWCVMLDRDRDDPDKTRRRIANPLARFAPEREDRWLKIRSGGDDGPVSLATAEPFTRERAAPARDEAEAALAAFLVSEPRATLSSSGGSEARSWSIADLARAIGRDPRDGTVKRAVHQLADEGFVHRNSGGRWQRPETLFDSEDQS